jgi:hypothetical protein
MVEPVPDIGATAYLVILISLLMSITKVNLDKAKTTDDDEWVPLKAFTV